MPTPPKPAGSKAARKRAAAPTTEASHKRAATRNNTPADEGDVLRFAHGAPAWLNVVQRAPGRSNPDRTHTRLHPSRTVHPLGGMPHSTTEELGGSGCASAASAAVPRRAIRRPSFSCSGSADEAQQLDAIVRAAGVTEFWQEQRSNVNLHFPSLVYDTYTHASDVPFSTQMKANYSWVMTFAVAGVACRCGAGRLASLLGIAAPSPRGIEADGSLEAVLFYDLLTNTAGCFLMGACAGASTR